MGYRAKLKAARREARRLAEAFDKRWEWFMRDPKLQIEGQYPQTGPVTIQLTPGLLGSTADVWTMTL